MDYARYLHNQSNPNASIETGAFSLSKCNPLCPSMPLSHQGPMHVNDGGTVPTFLKQWPGLFARQKSNCEQDPPSHKFATQRHPVHIKLVE